MDKIKMGILISTLLILSACAGSEYLGPPNPYQGTYVGTEILEGGTFPLKIFVDSSGGVRIVDDDGISVSGKLEGARFYIKRGSPRQIFEGSVSGKTISGVTSENPYLGGGTFSVTLRQ